MITFERFAAGAKMRHDFADQIQVRFILGGEAYAAWVSGEEALARLRSEDRERRLRGLSRLTRDDVRREWRALRDEGPERARDETERALRDRLADAMEGAIGGNVIGDSLADAVRGDDATTDRRAAEKARWRAELAETTFREQVLTLAWTALRGSFPEEDVVGDEGPDDWV